MKWFKRILITLAVLLVIAGASPFFITLNAYIPQIEKEASTRLQEPVSIKSIRFAALPLPHVTIDGIAVGTTDDIKLGKVQVTPALFSLLQSTKVIKSIEIDSLALSQKGIDKIAALAKSDTGKLPEQPPQARVESIRLNKALVSFGKANFGPFDARVSLDSKGEAEDASITTQDGKFKAIIKSDNSKYLIDASAKSWTLPVGPALVFDELIIKGVATRHDANLGEVSARLYGGTAIGKMAISWQNGLHLDGNLDIKQVETQKIASMLSPGTHVSGKLSAKPVFSASAASADQLMNVLRLATLFNVQNGALHGVDIQKAATSLNKQGKASGETRFDQLSGHLLMEHGGYRFSQLRIASGALAVDGEVNVSSKKALSGRVNAQVKALGTSTTVPLNVSGTVDAPLLYPTGGTMAGAAVGTAIMGPGVGTSVGVKVGNWVEGLFGKEEKKPKK
ncbi:hypothetical protein FGKAn22_05390 [Ferrigenium kumadai]|uniref:AsmA-like C-terminal domain-containing protein n=1 Tax=Ferrigenium kumadai TaxID=1682490 RepID=A0AAN1SYD9_9PROT|nr:hypothetical protein [Ferrigenium kumadai]BBI98846.1 hypothetical protein FGKAn22_05390 [Ferrigenium kumadai]